MLSHYHDEACLVLIQSGSVRHTEGTRSAILRPRSILYLPPAERHLDSFDRGGARCVVIKIDPIWVRRRLGGDGEGLEPKVIRDARLYALGVAIHRETKTPDDLSALIVEGSLLELLGKWKRERRHRGMSVPAWLDRVRLILVDSFRERISLQDVSRTAGVHPAHLAREFRRVYGVTAGEYVRKLRIDFVAQRLARTRTSNPCGLADLAQDAGFSSHAHMAFAFKRTTGYTPSEFRKIHRSHQGDESG
jgi:AraC family transcriptional regulator